MRRPHLSRGLNNHDRGYELTHCKTCVRLCLTSYIIRCCCCCCTCVQSGTRQRRSREERELFFLYSSSNRISSLPPSHHTASLILTCCPNDFLLLLRRSFLLLRLLFFCPSPNPQPNLLCLLRPKPSLACFTDCERGGGERAGTSSYSSPRLRRGKRRGRRRGEVRSVGVSAAGEEPPPDVFPTKLDWGG